MKHLNIFEDHTFQWDNLSDLRDHLSKEDKKPEDPKAGVWPTYVSIDDISKILKDNGSIDVKIDDRKNAIRFTVKAKRGFSEGKLIQLCKDIKKKLDNENDVAFWEHSKNAVIVCYKMEGEMCCDKIEEFEGGWVKTIINIRIIIIKG